MQDTKNLRQGANPLTEGYTKLKASSITSADKAAAGVFQDKTFGSEWAGLYTGGRIGGGVLAICSFLTLWGCINWGLSFRVPALVAAGVGIALAGLLEGAKGFLWLKCSKFILKYKNAHKALILASVALTLLSITGSAAGAYIVPIPSTSEAVASDSTAAPQADSIAGAYRAQIAQLDEQAAGLAAQIASTSSNSTKRTLASTQAGVIEARKAVAMELAKHSSITVHRIAQETTQAQKAKEAAAIQLAEDTKAWRTMAVSMAVLFDLLQCLLFCWTSYYLWRVYIESMENMEGIEGMSQPTSEAEYYRAAEPAHQQPAPAFASTEPAPRRIGFHNHGTSHRKPNVSAKNSLEPVAPHGLITDPDRQRHCDYCGRVYNYSNAVSKFCGGSCRGKMHRYNSKTK